MAALYQEHRQKILAKAKEEPKKKDLLVQLEEQQKEIDELKKAVKSNQAEAKVQHDQQLLVNKTLAAFVVKFKSELDGMWSSSRPVPPRQRSTGSKKDQGQCQ